MSDRVLQAFVAGIVIVVLMFGSCVAGVTLTVASGSILSDLGLAAPRGVPSGAPSEEVAGTFQTFWEVWHLVQTRYVDPEEADPEQLTEGAIRGMLDSLGDVGHTRYLTPEERAQEHSSLAGEFAGIGAEVAERDGEIVIVTPLEGSPAEAAGIRAGDVILAVDGQEVTDMTLGEVISKVRGEPGTDVTLTVLHPEAAEVIDITITRAIISLPAATWTLLPGNVAYVRMNQFSSNLHDELLGILDEAARQGAERYLVDVRNNPGGYVQQVVAVTSEFLPEGVVFIERNRAGELDHYNVNGRATVPDAPLVVLINEGSASAAEIFAGALKDQGRATLVGERTFGTGTVLNEFSLSDGSAVLLGIAEWLTPSGELIKGNGVAPDVMVALPVDVQPVSPRVVEGLAEEALLASPDVQFVEGYRLVREEQ